MTQGLRWTGNRPAGTRPSSEERARIRLHLTGALLLTAAIAWLQTVAWLRGGDAVPYVLMLAAAGAAFLVARQLAHRSRQVVPLLIVGAGALLTVTRWDVLLGSPHRAPLGYANAAGAFYALACAAALLVAVNARRPWQRIGAGAAALGFALVPVLNHTRTAAVLLSLLPFALLARTEAHARALVVFGCLLVVVTFGIVLGLGATYRSDRPQAAVQRLANSALSERRLQLWHDAVVLLRQEPLTGVGPGEFPGASPTARADRDTRWPHNEMLHFGAEAGLPGMLLLAAVFGWGFVLLGSQAHGPEAGLAALALGSLGVHAGVDYILHFPAVVVAAVALLASVTAARRGRREPAGVQLEPAHRGLLDVQLAGPDAASAPRELGPMHSAGRRVQ